MPEAAIDTIRRFYDAWLSGDDKRVYATFDDDIELHPDPEATWVGVGEVYRGPDGVRTYMRAVYEAFEDYRPEVEKLIDLDDRVLTLAIEHGKGRGSGASVQAHRTAHLWTLKDGKAVRLDLYLSRERAFADLGLDPQPA